MWVTETPGLSFISHWNQSWQDILQFRFELTCVNEFHFKIILENTGLYPIVWSHIPVQKRLAVDAIQ